MADELRGKRIAFLATHGVEEVELTEPWDALAAAGADLELVSVGPGEINAMNRRERADSFTVDTVVTTADVQNYDGLVLPGAVADAARLRNDVAAARFVNAFLERAKPVASMGRGHGDLRAFSTRAIALFARGAAPGT
jgi:protease I